MNKQTGIILVVVAVIIIGFMMYTSSQQAEKDRALQLQIASMNNGGTQESGGLAGILSSLGELGGLVGTIGGFFGGGGGGSTTTVGTTSYDLDSGIDPSSFRISTPHTGADVLYAKVQMDDLTSVESMI